MATYNQFRIGGTAGIKQGRVYHEHDLAKIIASGTALVSGDKVGIIAVPAGTNVAFYAAQLVTAASIGGTPRIDIGDSAADTTFVNNNSTVTAGTFMTIATASKQYNAADSIFLKLGNGSGSIASGIIRYALGLTDTTRHAKAVVPTYAH